MFEGLGSQNVFRPGLIPVTERGWLEDLRGLHEAAAAEFAAALADVGEEPTARAAVAAVALAGVVELAVARVESRARSIRAGVHTLGSPGTAEYTRRLRAEQAVGVMVRFLYEDADHTRRLCWRLRSLAEEMARQVAADAR